MSGSCIHIFLLLTLMLLPLAWIAGLIASSSIAVGSLVGTLQRVAQRTGYRQTKPHIGWMLFENVVKTVDV